MKQKLSKKIYILDCEFLYKTSEIPNYKAMKLSSYHTQIGDEVTFITKEYHLTGKHDVLYLIRELRNTPFPPGDILDDKRTVLIGKEFAMFEEVQEIPLEAAVCRPDYGVYDCKDGSLYANSSLVQFFNGSIFLKNKQDWRRSDNKNTIVVDDNLWDAPAPVVATCLRELIEEPNIIFQHPVKLKKLIDKEVLEVFIQLKLAKFYKLRYNNNVGEDYDSVIKIIDGMSILKKHFIYMNINSIPIKIITKDHWALKENIYYDFERCLKIMTYAQLNRVRINFRYPRMRLSSPSWFYFEFFKTWSNHFHTLSYIEALMFGATKFYHKSYADILSNDLLWNTAKVKQTVHLLARYPSLIKEYGFVGWGGVISTTSNKIDYNYVKEKAIENSIF